MRLYARERSIRRSGPGLRTATGAGSSSVLFHPQPHTEEPPSSHQPAQRSFAATFVVDGRPTPATEIHVDEDHEALARTQRNRHRWRRQADISAARHISSEVNLDPLVGVGDVRAPHPR